MPILPALRRNEPPESPPSAERDGRAPKGPSPHWRILGAAALILSLSVKGFAGSLVPEDLRTEYLRDPMGIGVRSPRFSWTLRALEPASRGEFQTAYEIRVTPSRGGAELWDSGVVASDGTSGLAYGGPALASRQACTWSVRVRDPRRSWSPWSPSASFTMGLLDSKDWSARWIGTGAVGRPPVPASRMNTLENLPPDPWLRREFGLKEKPVRATAFVASVGFHELYVNGEKVGDSVLMPSVTDNSQRARYMTYDISRLLRPGRNVVGIWLGTGWSVYPGFATADKPRAPIAMAEIDVEEPGGAEERIVTDGSWETHPSSNTLLGSWTFMRYGGELHDARSDDPRWAMAGDDTLGWTPALVFSPKLRVSAERQEPNRIQAPLRPVAVTEPEPGVFRVDFGRNFTGWVEARFEGRPGDSVTFQFSERADKAMTYGLHSTCIVGPNGHGRFVNRFNYETGRLVTIRGLRSSPDAGSMLGLPIRTDIARASAFECSEPLLDDIYRTTLWTVENLSLGGYLVDCPHRERMGYGGDAHSTTRTVLMNFKADAFFTKWAEDWRDVQGHEPIWASGGTVGGGGANAESGNLPYTAPTYWGGGGPVWSGYCVHLPWELYRHTGDLRILEESLGTIERWLAFLETKASGDILRRWGGDWDFLGDWLWPGAKGMNNDSPETLFLNNCYWVYNLDAAAGMARALGRQGQAAAWTSRAETVRRALHARFFNPADSSYVDGSQATLAAALLADVPPAGLRSAVWQRLEREILVIRKGHIHAGITGGALLFKVLMEANRDDLIYAMATQTDYPGWGDLLRRGETTFGEDWEGRESLLHSSYLFVGAWFINGILGIQPDPSAPGFGHFIIMPGPLDRPNLKWARGHYDSLKGRIDVGWRRDEKGFELNAAIPPNTTASVYLPAQSAESVLESGAPLARAAGVSSVEIKGGRLVVNVGSGTYRFTVAP